MSTFDDRVEAFLLLESVVGEILDEDEDLAILQECIDEAHKHYKDKKLQETVRCLESLKTRSMRVKGNPRRNKNRHEREKKKKKTSSGQKAEEDYKTPIIEGVRELQHKLNRWM